MAWHPADPLLLALACHDGSVGLLRLGQGSPAPCTVLAVRHKVSGWADWAGTATSLSQQLRLVASNVQA